MDRKYIELLRERAAEYERRKCWASITDDKEAQEDLEQAYQDEEYILWEMGLETDEDIADYVDGFDD